MDPPSLERFPPLKLILSKSELVCIIGMAPFFGFNAYIIEELFLYEKFTQWVIRKIRRFPLNQEHSTNFYIFMNNSS